LAYQERDYTSAMKYYQQTLEACQASPKGTWQDFCSETHYEMALTFLQVKDPLKAKSSLEACVIDAKEGSDMAGKCRQRLALLR